MRPERWIGKSAVLDPESDGVEDRKQQLRLVFPSSAISIRMALVNVLAGLRHLNLSDVEAGKIELVLAEVMNNIVEHAYAGSRNGIIELTISYGEFGLFCEVLDDGLPMPDNSPPPGKQSELNCSVENLPEGGFGWFLIRELASALDYKRDGNRNRLSFKLPVGQLAMSTE